MNRRLLFFLLSILILILAGNLVVLVAKGYNFNFKDKQITQTGIISVSSVPTQASVYLNGTLVTATNNNIPNLLPGKYTVKVSKDGYSSWEKQVEVKVGVVSPLEVVLFRLVPDLSPLTYTGVIGAKLSPDQTKVVYSVKDGDKTGLWVLDLNDQPIIFSKDPKQIVKDGNGFNFTDSNYFWAPDSKTVVVQVKDRPTVLFLNIDQLSQEPFNDVTASFTATTKTWADAESNKQKTTLAGMSKMANDLAVKANKIVFSPDEKRFLAFITVDGKDKAQVYDSKPSPDPSVKETISEMPIAKQYLWYADSRHVILVDGGTISIIENDGNNKANIYSGDLANGIVFPANLGNRLLIATSFNKSLGDLPNLYAINLR